MKILLDLDLCQGHSVCVEEAPEIFAVRENPDGYAFVELLVETVDPALYDKARNAARYCPNNVIRIVEDGQ